MKHTIQEENWREKFRIKFHRYNMEDNRDVMVEELSGDLEDFISSLLASQLQSILESLEKEKLLEVAVNPERLLQKQYYNKGIEKGRSIISNRMGTKI